MLLHVPDFFLLVIATFLFLVDLLPLVVELTV